MSANNDDHMAAELERLERPCSGEATHRCGLCGLEKNDFARPGSRLPPCTLASLHSWDRIDVPRASEPVRVECGQGACAAGACDVHGQRTNEASPEEPTEEQQQRNFQMHHTLALIHGFNAMVTKATTLGEKVYYRMARDAAEKRFSELGGQINRIDERAPVLVIPCHVPEIRFDERDIDLMRECVARYEREAQRTEPAWTAADERKAVVEWLQGEAGAASADAECALLSKQARAVLDGEHVAEQERIANVLAEQRRESARTTACSWCWRVLPDHEPGCEAVELEALRKVAEAAREALETYDRTWPRRAGDAADVVVLRAALAALDATLQTSTGEEKKP